LYPEFLAVSQCGLQNRVKEFEFFAQHHANQRILEAWKLYE